MVIGHRGDLELVAWDDEWDGDRYSEVRPQDIRPARELVAR